MSHRGNVIEFSLLPKVAARSPCSQCSLPPVCSHWGPSGHVSPGWAQHGWQHRLEAGKSQHLCHSQVTVPSPLGVSKLVTRTCSLCLPNTSQQSQVTSEVRSEGERCGPEGPRGHVPSTLVLLEAHCPLLAPDRSTPRRDAFQKDPWLSNVTCCGDFLKKRATPTPNQPEAGPDVGCGPPVGKWEVGAGPPWKCQWQSPALSWAWF